MEPDDHYCPHCDSNVTETIYKRHKQDYCHNDIWIMKDSLFGVRLGKQQQNNFNDTHNQILEFFPENKIQENELVFPNNDTLVEEFIAKKEEQDEIEELESEEDCTSTFNFDLPLNINIAQPNSEYHLTSSLSDWKIQNNISKNAYDSLLSLIHPLLLPENKNSIIIQK